MHAAFDATESALAAEAFSGELLILDRQADDYLAFLAPHLPSARLHACTSPQAALAFAGAPIWLASSGLAAALLRIGASPPAWLQTTSAGIEPLFGAGMPVLKRLSRAVGIFGSLMAEYALTYMLAWRRQVFARADAQRRGDWGALAPGTLAGLRVLVAGTGVIGQALPRLLSPFGAEWRGIASQARHVPGFLSVETLDTRLQAAANADVVINILPDTPCTRDIYDAAFFAAMPAGGFFINMGRGTAVVDADLVQALNSGHLGAAAIDVCREEPPPAAHPFWCAPRLWLTGHSAGPTLLALMAPLFLENLGHYRQGLALRGEVDLARAY